MRRQCLFKHFSGCEFGEQMNLISIAVTGTVVHAVPVTMKMAEVNRCHDSSAALQDAAKQRLSDGQIL